MSYLVILEPKKPKFLSLATEILEDLFSYLSRRQLTSVARVCKSFALCGRLLLYRSIDFCSDDPYMDATLTLLRGNYNMGVKILSATLTTRRPLGGDRRWPWIEPNFLFPWTRLRSLELRGFPFSEPRDIEVFRTTLQRYCPKLEKFTYRPAYGFLPRAGFELAGLKIVRWHSEGLANIDMPIMPIMKASVASLTDISFIGTIFHMREKPYDQFLQLRFPCLKSLELGSLSHSNSQARTNITTTAFILAHTSIEHLSLGRNRPTYFCFQFDSSQLKPESLPSLKSFEGFPENITAMAHCPVHSLFSITSLSIYCQKEEDDFNQSAQDMFTAVSGAQGTDGKLSSVTYLRLEFFVVLDHRMPLNQTSLAHLAWMDKLSLMCPGVVEFYGNLPPMTSIHIRKLFAMYDQLETISLPRLSIFLHMPSSLAEENLEQYFRCIVWKCQKLKTVIARKPPYTELEDRVFTITRDENGKLLAVDEGHSG